MSHLMPVNLFQPPRNLAQSLLTLLLFYNNRAFSPPHPRVKLVNFSVAQLTIYIFDLPLSNKK
jgi:hypothetical protein